MPSDTTLLVGLAAGVVLMGIVAGGIWTSTSPGYDMGTVTPAPVPTDTPAPPTPQYTEDDTREFGGFGEELGGDPAGSDCTDVDLSSEALRRGLLDDCGGSP